MPAISTEGAGNSELLLVFLVTQEGSEAKDEFFFFLSLSSLFLAIIFRFCKNSSKLFTIEFKVGETVRYHTSAGSCTSAFMKVL